VQINQYSFPLDCTVYPGFRCTQYDGLSPFSRRRQSKKRKIRIKKVVHYIPESVVQYVPESIVHFIPEYSNKNPLGFVDVFFAAVPNQIFKHFDKANKTTNGLSDEKN